MSGLRITIRGPANRDFINGFPGIPGSSNGVRVPAHVSGTIEIRSKAKGVKALFVHVELKKIERIENRGSSRYKELIGTEATVLWQSKKPRGSVDGSYDLLLSLALPEGLPPTAIVDQRTGVGISYEIVCTVMTKPKSSKDPVPVTAAVPITVEKHNLHSAWPIYQAAIEDRQAEVAGVWMCVKRSTVGIGPGDSIAVTVQMKTARVDPIKLARLELALREVVTFRGDLQGPGSSVGSAGEQRVKDVTEVKQVLNQTIYPNDLQTFELKGQLPSSHNLLTVSTAKHITVNYSIRVRAVLERAHGTVGPLSELLIDQLPVVVGHCWRPQAEKLVDRIIEADGIIPPFLNIQRVSQPSTSTLRGSASSSGTFPRGRDSVSSSHRALTTRNPALYADDMATTSSVSSHSRQSAQELVGLSMQRLAHNRSRASQSQSQTSSDPYGLEDMPEVLAPSQFRVVNEPEPYESAMEEKERLRRADEAAELQRSTTSTATTVPRGFETAEAEKARLHAQALAERDAYLASEAADQSSSSHEAPTTSHWASAEDENRRLFEQAKQEHAAWAASEQEQEPLNQFSIVEDPSASPSTPIARHEEPARPSVLSSAAAEKAALAARYASDSSLARADPVSLEKQRFLQAVAERDAIQSELEETLSRRSVSPRPPSVSSPPLSTATSPRPSSVASPRPTSWTSSAPDHLPSYDTSSQPNRDFNDAVAEKQAIARQYAGQNGASNSSRPRHSATPSIASDMSVFVPRDPAIAAGKRRAINQSDESNDSANRRLSYRNDPIDRGTSPRLYGLATLRPLSDAIGAPPPRPAKTPLPR